MNGWISLHRRITEHWIWKDPQKLRAWLDIVISANFAETTEVIGSQTVKVKRGQILRSYEEWAFRWRWSKSGVSRFFRTLKDEKMITTENLKSAKTTRLTVLNYDTYQNIRNGNTAGTVIETVSDTVNGTVKSLKNNEKANVSETEFGTVTETVTETVEGNFNLINNNKFNNKENKERERKKEINKEKKKNRNRREDYGALFLKFWAAYPRKDGKHIAKKAFEKIDNVGDLLPEILDSIECKSKSIQWQNPQYIPLASTYLNQRRWEDENEIGGLFKNGKQEEHIEPIDKWF